jgi:chromosome segregation ATPase
MSHICQYCKKTFLNKNNLEKHINHPSQKCIEFRNSLKKTITHAMNVVARVPDPVEVKNLDILKNYNKEINKLNNIIITLENKIKEYQTLNLDYEKKCLEYETLNQKYETRVEDYKSLINNYQKDYFDCLDKYILAFKENYDLKKSLQKSSDFNQMIELKYINISKSN